MKISLLLLAMLITGITAFTQDTVNRTNAHGQKTGFWQKTDTAGHKVYEGHFRDGIPVGEFRYYYPGGHIKTTAIMSDHGQKARTRTFAGNGKMIAEGNYLSEKKDSIWRYYSEFDGVLISEENYTHGLKNGICKTFYANGNLAEQLTYHSGIKEGEWIQFFEDGKIKFRGNYLNDEKNGRFIAFYPDGKPAITGSYSSGHKDGTWNYYEEKGQLYQTEKYDKGALIIEKKP